MWTHEVVSRPRSIFLQFIKDEMVVGSVELRDEKELIEFINYVKNILSDPGVSKAIRQVLPKSQ